MEHTANGNNERATEQECVFFVVACMQISPLVWIRSVQFSITPTLVCITEHGSGSPWMKLNRKSQTRSVANAVLPQMYVQSMGSEESKSKEKNPSLWNVHIVCESLALAISHCRISPKAVEAVHTTSYCKHSLSWSLWLKWKVENTNWAVQE